MRATSARMTAAAASVLILVAILSWQPADAAAATRNIFGAQCSFDSPSGQVRLWWTENRGRNVLSGDDGGVASDGQCSTVPVSVPWMAGQLETIMRGYKAVGLPMTKSDKGIQHVDNHVLDNGSGAFDVFLDGYTDSYAQAEAECWGVTSYPRRGRQYRTVANMHVYGVPATVPDAERTPSLLQAVAHEFVHVAQCAVTNPRRTISASDLHGPWIEAVPNALSLGLVGGAWDIGDCTQDTKLLSLRFDDEDPGYAQWPFWYSLLGAPSTSAYLATLRDVIRAPVPKSGPQLARVIHQRFTNAQINRALLFWITSEYFGGTLPSASGVPITWPVKVFSDGAPLLVDEVTGAETPTVEDSPIVRLSPPAGGSAQVPVTIAPMTCAALRVPWPDGAQTLAVGATGAPGGNVADVMAAGLDVAPGSPATTRCGAKGQRAIVPLTGNQFTATRPCQSRNGAPEMWVVMVNGGTTPLTLTVTATAS